MTGLSDRADCPCEVAHLEPFVTVQLDPVKLAAVYRPALVDRWVTLTVTPPGGVPHELTGWVCNVTDDGAYPQPVGPYLMVGFDIPGDDGYDSAANDLLTSGLLVVQDAEAVARVHRPPPGVRPPMSELLDISRRSAARGPRFGDLVFWRETSSLDGAVSDETSRAVVIDVLPSGRLALYTDDGRRVGGGGRWEPLDLPAGRGAAAGWLWPHEAGQPTLKSPAFPKRTEERSADGGAGIDAL